MTDLDQIEREMVIDAPIERLWALLTQAEHVGTWFTDAGAEIDLRPGGAMTLTWREHGTTHARVERVVPPRFFSYRWSDEAETEPAEGHATLVEWSLTAEGGGTRVRVVESGFASLDTSDEDRRRRFEENTDGWRIQLDNLAEQAARVTT